MRIVDSKPALVIPSILIVISTFMVAFSMFVDWWSSWYRRDGWMWNKSCFLFVCRNGVCVSIYSFTRGTFAHKYVEQLTTQPIAFIYTAIWAKIYPATSLLQQLRLVSRMSTSELGRDNPTALEPNRTALAIGKSIFENVLTLSKAIILWL